MAPITFYFRVGRVEREDLNLSSTNKEVQAKARLLSYKNLDMSS